MLYKDLDLKQIKPKNIKISDKYSANLYKFVKNNMGYVYFYNKNIYNETVDLDWNELSTNNIFIGSNMMDEIYEKDDKKINIGCVIAKRLGGILNGYKLYETGAYCGFGGFYPKRDFIDITDEFWDRYIEIGRCLFHDHDAWIQGADSRFEIIDENTRKCNWCGKIEHREILKQVKEKEVWR